MKLLHCTFFFSYISCLHITLKTLKSIVSIQIEKKQDSDPKAIISDYLTNEGFCLNLSSNFGIDCDRFKIGIQFLEAILAKCPEQTPRQNYDQEIAYLDTLTGTLIERSEVIGLRRALSHHGAISNLDEIEQCNLLALLAKLDDRYQALLSIPPPPGSRRVALNIQTVAQYTPISNYEYFSSSFAPFLNIREEAGDPFFYSTLLASRQRQSFDPKTEGLILHAIFTHIKASYQSHSWREKKNFDERSNVILLISTWAKVYNAKFDAFTHQNYPKQILDYLLLFLKASIFGDIPHIPSNSRNSNLKSNALLKSIEIFLLQLRMQKRRQEIYNIASLVNPVFIQSLQAYNSFLLKTFELFKEEKVLRDASLPFYALLFNLIEKELLFLEENPPAPPSSAELFMKPFTDLSLQKAFLNRISFSVSTEIILQSCFFEIFVLFFDHELGPINPAIDSFDVWLKRTDPLRIEFESYLGILFTHTNLHTILSGQFFLQLLRLFYDLRMIDSSFLYSPDQRHGVITSTYYRDPAITPRLMPIIKIEQAAFSGGDKQAVDIKFGACFFSHMVTLFIMAGRAQVEK
jgi:hypothetical protein